MNTVRVQDNVYWIGYVDWDVRDFHGYTTKRGSTYNSYLIMDEKIAVIDTVKAPYVNSLIRNIKERTDLAKVDYVICNHAEPDHSGGLPELMKICVNAEVICNEKCKSILSMHYDTSSWKFKIVDEETTLSLGACSLKFINTPMAHWPESMFTYLPEKKILFSMDAFGQHFASSGRFDSEVDLYEVMEEAKTYYANIIMLYGRQIEKTLEKASELDIEIIAPSHGIIWRKNISKIIMAYKNWSLYKPVPKVLIFFDTMWKSTAMMGDAIYEGANELGVTVKKYDLKNTNTTIIAQEAMEAAAIAVGSPTLNRGLMPKVAEALTYLKGLAPKGKIAVAFGSYGWAKRGGQHEVQTYLEAMSCDILTDSPIQSQFVPTEETLNECRNIGKKLAEAALKKSE